MDWKQYESTALTYFFMTYRFENKSKIGAIVLNEIKEMKIGCSFRTTVPVGRRFLKKKKRCQGRRNCAESNTGATNLKFKENRVD